MRRATSRSRAAGAGWVVVSAIAALPACNQEAKNRCQEAFKSAQKSMNNASSRSTSDLGEVDGELAQAVATCEEAGIDEAVVELTKARKKVREQIEHLNAAEDKPETRKLTSEEIEKLVREGDPSCPKGQAYTHKASGKQIRCKGPLPANMAWAEAKTYFDRRGFNFRDHDPKSVMKLEYGAELLFLHYAKPGDTSAPKCLVAYPPPGRSWQEAVSRLTGANPSLLRKDGTVKTNQGAMKLRIEEGENKLVVSIGDCPES